MTDKPITDVPKDKDDVLASEFAMGLLEGGAKRAAEKRFEDDLSFRNLVEAWQMRLSPLLNEVDEVSPPAKVWNDIDRQLWPEQQVSIWSRLNFWRGFSVVSTIVAALAIVFIISTNEVTKPSQVLVASLSGDSGLPALFVKYDSESNLLNVNIGDDLSGEANVAELWLIPADGVPRSLGLLTNLGANELILADVNKNLVSDGGTLAISLEPLGGSSTGAPTGPVIASGKLQIL